MLMIFGLALLFGSCYAAGAEEGSSRKIIIILGAPCAGCGTQSPSIIKTLGIPHLDTGNMLRQAAESGTAAGITAGKMMKEGVLVSDEIVNQVVEDRIKQPDCAKGFLLDGYPRNVAQSKRLDGILAKTGESVTDVLSLRVPMKGLQQCVMHRWTSDSGDEWTSDYIAFRVPKSLQNLRLHMSSEIKAQCQLDDLEHCNMWDDWTGEPLLRRADDNLKTLAERYKIYEAQTYPVLDHYTSQHVIRNVDGYQPEPKVWADIEKALGLSPSAGLIAAPPLSAIALASGSKDLSRRKIIIILGAPCAGCGTQSPSIINALGVPHLDTGNMLRQAAESGTAAGRQAGKMMKEGVLVTDAIVNQVVEDRIKQPDCAKGFLLDGYPRNVAQSTKLDSILAKTGESVTDVLVLNVPMKGLQQCVMHRWTSDSGDEWTSNYLAFRVPKSLKTLPAGTEAQCQPDDLKHCNMWDDWTGEPLYRRADDNLNTLAERYKIFKAQTYPVLDHYTSQNVIRNVDGYQEEPKVWADIEQALGLPPSAGLLAKPAQASEVLTPMAALALVASGAVAIATAVITRPRNGEMLVPLIVE